MDDLLLKTLVFGGVDGIITIFNIISSVEGAKLNYKYIFILGMAALISDAISMGTGEYLSLKADIKYKINNNINTKKDRIPYRNGILMFISFIVFGFIPLLLYLLINKFFKKNNYIITYFSVILALFTLGVVQSKFTKEKWYISGGQVSLYGGAAAFIAFNISSFISSQFS